MSILQCFTPVTESGCWLWEGLLDAYGYGRVSAADGNTIIKAHRYFWTHHVGAIPPGMSILHKCDVRCCVNPAHLFMGTQADNMRDCSKKQRIRNGNSDGTHCKNGHALSGDNLSIETTGFRRCKTCRTKYLANYYQERKAK